MLSPPTLPHRDAGHSRDRPVKQQHRSGQNSDSPITEEHLLETARKHLGKFKLPRRFVIQTEPLPKGGTGKILKNQIRAQFWTTPQPQEKQLTK